MKLAITGADGRIGRVLTRHWHGAHEVTTIGNKHDLRVPGAWQALLADAETIVHLAAVLADVHDFALLRDNLAIVMNVVGASASARRIVYASSIWASTINLVSVRVAITTAPQNWLEKPS